MNWIHARLPVLLTVYKDSLLDRILVLFYLDPLQVYDLSENSALFYIVKLYNYSLTGIARLSK